MNNADDKSLDAVFGAIVARYSRQQALDDGFLVDVTSVAREAGFRWEVALTHAAWCDCVAWEGRDSCLQVPQDESGRLWDVLFMAYYAISTAASTGDCLQYTLYRVPRDGHATAAEEVSLKLMVGPGDAGEPVITIMLPNED